MAKITKATGGTKLRREVNNAQMILKNLVKHMRNTNEHIFPHQDVFGNQKWKTLTTKLRKEFGINLLSGTSNKTKLVMVPEDLLDHLNRTVFESKPVHLNTPCVQNTAWQRSSEEEVELMSGAIDAALTEKDEAPTSLQGENHRSAPMFSHMIEEDYTEYNEIVKRLPLFKMLQPHLPAVQASQLPAHLSSPESEINPMDIPNLY